VRELRLRESAGLRFCGQCGGQVSKEDRPLRDARSYTPKHLADRILQSKSALEGERKQVTVLFADVKGSRELAERVDPEQWHAILDGFFGVLAEGVHRFEGTVNQYTGDGIMALFGAPIAHEDHAQRACYAALQLRDELAKYAREVKREHGLGFSVRVAERMGTRMYELPAQLARARALLSQGGPAAALEIEAALERASALVRATGARSYEPEILEVRARLARASSDPAACERLLREAEQLHAELGATGHAARLAQELVGVG